MIWIAGRGSTITQKLVARIGGTDDIEYGSLDCLRTDAESYFIASGVLHGEPVGDDHLSAETLMVNFAKVAAVCDRIIDANPVARIVVMGSESGFAGSFDMAYAGAKAALHLYVETKRLIYPRQTLNAIAPTVIEDTRMTETRKDLELCLARGTDRRRQHWLRADEVARVAQFLLYQETGAISNTVIRMTGGNW